jgi:hypothetical protein
LEINSSFNAFHPAMDPAGNDENHLQAAAFKVRGKARHITGSLAS